MTDCYIENEELTVSDATCSGLGAFSTIIEK